jgi:hypothetical protein
MAQAPGVTELDLLREAMAQMALNKFGQGSSPEEQALMALQAQRTRGGEYDERIAGMDTGNIFGEQAGERFRFGKAYPPGGGDPMSGITRETIGEVLRLQAAQQQQEQTGAPAPDDLERLLMERQQRMQDAGY